MASTSVRGIPYPAGSDQPDGAGAFQALAQKIEDQDPFAMITGTQWPLLQGVWDAAHSKWRPWESRWAAHGAPANYTNGANGSALALSKWQGGDLLLRGKIVFGSSSPALPTTVQFPIPAFTGLSTTLTIDEAGYQPSGEAWYQRAGVKTVMLGASFNAGNLLAQPMGAQTLNGGSHLADGVAWPYPNPAQSDTLFCQIRLQVAWT